MEVEREGVERGGERVRVMEPIVSAFFHNRRVDLESQPPFVIQWQQVVEVLQACEKPACLIAHNGMT